MKHILDIKKHTFIYQRKVMRTQYYLEIFRGDIVYTMLLGLNPDNIFENALKIRKEIIFIHLN